MVQDVELTSLLFILFRCSLFLFSATFSITKGEKGPFLPVLGPVLV